jgi:hypothetical protein
MTTSIHYSHFHAKIRSCGTTATIYRRAIETLPVHPLTNKKRTSSCRLIGHTNDWNYYAKPNDSSRSDQGYPINLQQLDISVAFVRCQRLICQITTLEKLVLRSALPNGYLLESTNNIFLIYPRRPLTLRLPVSDFPLRLRSKRSSTSCY